MTGERRYGRGRAPAALAALALAVAGCGGGSGGSTPDAGNASGEPAPFTVMLNWTPNNHHAGIYIARQQGWYAEAGLDVTIVEPAQAGVEQVVGSGQADVGISVAEGVLPAREQGLAIVSIATILPVNDSALMSLTGSGITRPRDLEGKTYGGYEGPLERELISRLVECDGGDPAKVNIVSVGNADYLAGMQADRFDAVWIFQGWDALREGARGKVDLIPFAEHTDCIPNWYTPVFIASEQAIAERPEGLRAFLSATARGYRAAMADPGLAAEALLAGAPELDGALVEASAAYYRDKYALPGSAWGTQDGAVWSAFEEFARTSGLIGAPVDTRAAFTDTLLPAGG